MSFLCFKDFPNVLEFLLETQMSDIATPKETLAG